MKQFNSNITINHIFLPILAGLILLFQTPAIANTQKIAILPFEIHSQSDLSYIGEGINQMLASRLSWKDHVLVVESRELAARTSDSMKAVAKGLGADYVLSGSITEFAGAFSLDATVFNSRDNRLETFFGQAETMEDIIPKLDILAAKINHKLFDRKTAAFETMEPAAPEEKTRDIRANPETLMPKAMESDLKSSKDRPFWKIWGKDGPSTGEKEDRPFWKFWGKDAPDDEFDAANNVDPDNMETTETIGDIISSEKPPEQKEDKPFWKFW